MERSLVKLNNNLSEKINHTIWNPEEKKDGVESYFLKINNPEKNCSLFLKFTFLNSAINGGFASVWAIYFDTDNPENNLALKQDFTSRDIAISKEVFNLKIGPNTLTTGFTSGKVIGENSEVTWELTFDTGSGSLIHFPYQAMYYLKFPKNKISSPYVDTKFYGSISVNGKKIEFNGKKGMQGHNYGVCHSDNWIWTHCNKFDNIDEKVVFEAVSSKLKLGGITTPPLTIIYFKNNDKEFLLNSLSDFFKNKSEVGKLSWDFQGIKDNYLIEGRFWEEPKNFIGLTYLNPDLTKVYCLNSMVANCKISLKLFKDGKYITEKEFYSTNTSALEIGSKDDLMGVSIRI